MYGLRHSEASIAWANEMLGAPDECLGNTRAVDITGLLVRAENARMMALPRVGDG